MTYPTPAILNTLTRTAKQVLLSLLTFCCVQTSSAQPLDRSKIIVSYAYNFAKHIKWPDEEKLASFSFALFDVKNRNLINEFDKLNESVRIKGVDINVTQTSNISALANYNVIYVDNSDDETIASIQEVIEGRPILLITHAAADKRLVMINLYNDQSEKLKFEINKANLLNSKLMPQPELILLGGTEIDVAKLFREGQSSLIKLQNKLAIQQGKLESQQNKLQLQQRQLETQQTKLKLQQSQLDLQQASLDILIKNNILQEKNYNSLLVNIKGLNEDIEKTRRMNSELSDELKTLKTTIASNKTTIVKQRDEIEVSKRQKKTLAEQVEKGDQELAKKQAALDKKQLELVQKDLELNEQQRRLEDISRSIVDEESKLNRLNVTIEAQQRSLEEQTQSIKKLDELVNAQKRSLYFLWGIIALSIALFLLAFIAYRSKREDNERLAKKSHDLQIARDKLALAKQKAERANQAKSVFLSLMSHELRTPLQSIIGYTDLVIEELEAEGNISYSDQLIRVTNNGQRLLTLINNTLDLAKIEAGKMEVQLTRTNISALIEEAVSNIKPLFKKNDNKLLINIDNNTRTPSIDYDKSLHILVNLLSNATKFTNSGTVTISVHNKPHYLKLMVSDTGVGLTKNQLDTIFYQFNQVDHKNALRTKGTGLGLSITKHFCELMGGQITTRSEKGVGTSFSVTIPLPVVINNSKTILEMDVN
ncbi:MAG: signal transduction histidine kinase [Pseudohongiellaceae bacterium]